MKYDLVVVGGGPGGYVAAIRASQLGMKVACVDRGDTLGGTCLNVGCIPSKALLESSERYAEALGSLADHGVNVSGVSLDLDAMQGRKDKIVKQLTGGIGFLFKKNKIDRLVGTGRLSTPGAVQVTGAEEISLEAERVLIATGSIPSSIPGVEWDGDRIGGSTEALSYPEVPGHLIVIGAGVIGLELGSVWLRLGSRVTVLEYMDHVLPGMDREVTKAAQRLFNRQGFDLRLGSRVTSAVTDGETGRVELEGGDVFEADRVLVAVGRAPMTEGLGLEEAGVRTDRRGFIEVDGDYRTSVEGVWAIGDVIGGAMLAHKASDEGIACVEKLVTGYGHVNYGAIPAIVYTDPEVASVGKTEEQLMEEGIPFKKGSFNFKGNGRALALASTDGMVKILAHADTDRVLGVHAIGPRAGDLIAEAALAMEFSASAEDIARACHAHPTLAEAVKEAALDVDGRAIHS